MIDKDLLTATVNEAIEGTSLFLVDIDVRPGNTIVVEVDSTEGVDIDQCVAITRKLRNASTAMSKTTNLKSDLRASHHHSKYAANISRI